MEPQQKTGPRAIIKLKNNDKVLGCQRSYPEVNYLKILV